MANPLGPTGARWLGVAGSVLLAAGAYRAGALPGTADHDGLGHVPALAICALGLLALTVAWWSLRILDDSGAYSPPEHPRSTDGGGRWMVITAVLWVVPLCLAPPLGSRDVYAYACQGATFAGTSCAWLDSVPPIWRGEPSPYGPLATLLSAGAAEASGGRVVVAVVLLRLVALGGVGLATWCGARLARQFGVPAGPAAWLGLASPLVLLHAVGGAHHDALMTGLVLAAFAAAANAAVNGTASGRGWGVVAGAALGLAVAVKVTAVVALPFVVLALPRARLREAATVTASGAAAYLALALPTGLGVGFLDGLRGTGDLVQWTSPPTAVGMTAGYVARALGFPAQDVTVAVARGAGLAALAGLIVAALWWTAHARDRTRAAVLAAGVAFAGVALLGPVFYPWYAVTPLALVAVSTVDERIRARVGAAAGALAFLVLPNGVGLAPRTKLPGAIAVTASLIAMAGWHGRRARSGNRERPRATAS